MGLETDAKRKGIITEIILRLGKLEDTIRKSLTGGGSNSAIGIIAAVYNTAAAQSISNAGVDIVNFGTLVKDTNSAVTTGVNWKFTAPTSGYYEVNAQILFASTLTWAKGEGGRLSVYINGTLEVHIDRKDNYDNGGATNYMQLSGSTVVYMNAGDYLDVRINQNSGGALSLFNDADFNQVSIAACGGTGPTGPAGATGPIGSVNPLDHITVPADTTSAFTMYKADGVTPIFTVDSVNSRIGIGTTSPQAILNLSVGAGIFGAFRLDFSDASQGFQFSAYEAGTLKGGVNWIGSTFTTATRRNNLEFVNSFSGGAIAFRANNGGVNNEVMYISAKGNVVVGIQAALATTDTDGFLYIPTSAGAPTGVPTSYTGKVAIQYDTTNNRLYVYNGSWKSIVLL